MSKSEKDLVKVEEKKKNNEKAHTHTYLYMKKEISDRYHSKKNCEHAFSIIATQCIAHGSKAFILNVRTADTKRD